MPLSDYTTVTCPNGTARFRHDPGNKTVLVELTDQLLVDALEVARRRTGLFDPGDLTAISEWGSSASLTPSMLLVLATLVARHGDTLTDVLKERVQEELNLLYREVDFRIMPGFREAFLYLSLEGERIYDDAVTLREH